MKKNDEIQNQGPLANQRYRLANLLWKGAPDVVVANESKKFLEVYQKHESSSKVENSLRLPKLLTKK